MNKSNHFIFAVALTLLTLFILGSLATSARATNLSIVDITPTPTIMPPETPPGETLSVEEQDELKATIQTYIEIRYRALSISEADDFKKNGFGDAVSDIHKAKMFQSEEMGKLAVEIKQAELDHHKYVKFKYFLDFHNFTLDTSSQTATVSVIEENEIVDEISAKLDTTTVLSLI